MGRIRQYINLKKGNFNDVHRMMDNLNSKHAETVITTNGITIDSVPINNKELILKCLELIENEQRINRKD